MLFERGGGENRRHHRARGRVGGLPCVNGAGGETLLGFVVCHDRILPVDPVARCVFWTHENKRTTLIAEDAEEIQMQETGKLEKRFDVAPMGGSPHFVPTFVCVFPLRPPRPAVSACTRRQGARLRK